MGKDPSQTNQSEIQVAMRKGPIGAAVATLMDIGWQPIDPSEWITSASDGASLSGNASSNLLAGFTKAKGHAVRQVLHRLEGDLEADVSSKASLSYNGKGLERGLPSFEPASKAHANFVRKGEYKKAKAVELAVNNKIWTKQRLLDSKIIVEREAMCERCGGIHIETNFHRYYDCSANHAIEHDDVSKTHYLAKKRQADASPSLQMVPGHYAGRRHLHTGGMGP